MPSAVPITEPTTAVDDLDALFNFDAGLEEAIASANRAIDASTDTDNTQPLKGTNIDEEIVVTKQRQPIAKLDEDRILSSKGIPRLRKISKQLRFKGKGHEFSDITKVLQMYQLWLDDLYPRAKFADGLALIEKLGHKKRMQVMRKSWIDEAKSKQMPEPDGTPEEDSRSIDERVGPAAQAISGHENATVARPDPAVTGEEDVSVDRPPEDDELDVLLAEAEDPPVVLRDAFADEEEIMADMGW